MKGNGSNNITFKIYCILVKCHCPDRFHSVSQPHTLYLSIYLSNFRMIYLAIHISISVSVNPLFISVTPILSPLIIQLCLSICLSVCLSVRLSVYLPLSLSLSICHHLTWTPFIIDFLSFILSISFCFFGVIHLHSPFLPPPHSSLFVYVSPSLFVSS